MATIASVILQRQEHMRAEKSEQIVRNICFDDRDEALAFKESFGEQHLFDGTESRYIVRVSEALVNTTVTLIYSIQIENGRYVMNHGLFTADEIANSRELNAAVENQSSAFALSKNGELIELEGDNVGINTFYTMVCYLVEDLNNGRH